jgi:cytoskeletal protein RodZ
MDEELVETTVPTVGERLRAAREAQKMNLEDIAAQTRIPQRHLESIEAADWGSLPAPTYTVGFAKSYASAVGLDRTEIGDQLREEMGGQRFTPTVASEVFEPADPARTMPKWLVLGAIAAVILIVLLMSWLSHRSLNQGDDQANVAAAAPAAPIAPAPTSAAAQGPVVLTASEPVWLSIYDKAGAKYFEGTLAAGQSFTVPPNAAAPLLKTGKPEALKVNVGTALAPGVGPAATTVSDVSLLPADLMRAGAAAPAQAAPPPASPAPAPPPPAPRAKPKPRAPAVSTAPPPAPADTAPAAPSNTNG